MLKNRLRKLHRPVFKFAEKHLKVHITPVHFYSPIPDTNELSSDIYTRENNCVGLDLSEGEQLDFFDDNLSKYVNEYVPPVNPGLSQVDGFILYALIRHKKPNVLIEIGSGDSTRISLEALKKNRAEGADYNFTAIEPYPKAYLKSVADPDFELIEKKAQDVDAEFLSQADLLFIDSSHVARIGSDVNHEILNVVPRLKVGAIVHWHDIMIPFDYHKAWIDSGNMFWNESYMVHAFMLYNKSFRIIWASRYMQEKSSSDLTSRLDYFQPDDPGQQLSSFWIERVS